MSAWKRFTKRSHHKRYELPAPVRTHTAQLRAYQTAVSYRKHRICMASTSQDPCTNGDGMRCFVDTEIETRDRGCNSHHSLRPRGDGRLAINLLLCFSFLNSSTDGTPSCGLRKKFGEAKDVVKVRLSVLTQEYLGNRYEQEPSL